MQPDLTFFVAGFEEIAWGVALVAIIMVLHGLGMVWTLRAVHGMKVRLGPSAGLAASLLVLVIAAWMITVAHLVEVFAWAGFLHWKRAAAEHELGVLPLAPRLHDARLRVRPSVKWRLLEGMIAISGLMTFAWSTGVLFALAQEFQTRELHRRDRPASSGG
jgi:hypothetical protein